MDADNTIAGKLSGTRRFRLPSPNAGLSLRFSILMAGTDTPHHAQSENDVEHWYRLQTSA